MDIILTIILFYIHLILHLAPYMVSGVVVYFYFLYKEEKQFAEAVDSYMLQFGVSREAAVKAITTDPL